VILSIYYVVPTAYPQVVDAAGNACSFINSNYLKFGTGIVPEGCGFSLQNRGAGFSMDAAHPNAAGPHKRPYHTLVPGMATNDSDGSLFASFSNMGGFMQPQGHVQLLVGLLDRGLDPQAAIDASRVCLSAGAHDSAVELEDGIPADVLVGLRGMGHAVGADVIRGWDRQLFGKAQIIMRDRSTGVLWGGSDGRGDGCAIGY
jgi:gamma-glutamyltranspeptidase/glutathione hydrolase